MPRDPYAQREDERQREDDEYAERLRQERADRLADFDPDAAVDLARTRRHLEVIADAAAAPGTHAAIGFDPADGGRMLVAPVRVYACQDHPIPRAVVVPKAVKDQAGNVVGYHYPIADGPFCVQCGRHMARMHREEGGES